MQKTAFAMAIILMALSADATPVAPYFPPQHPFAPKVQVIHSGTDIYFTFDLYNSSGWINLYNETTGDDFNPYVVSGNNTIGPITEGVYDFDFQADQYGPNTSVTVYWYDGTTYGGRWVDIDGVSADDLNGQTVEGQIND